jgi:uncharacterized protein YqjF (DUF2071 family)
LKRPFLTAQWRDLVVVNYEIDPTILAQYVPAGTELDLWQGSALVSLVAFRFLDTKVLGVPIPFHRNFEEFNLRFYVRRLDSNQLKRGVVFIKELVPKRAIATVARLVYNENYFCVPTTHKIDSSDNGQLLVYRWWERGHEQCISAQIEGVAQEPSPDSEAEFILEHYWGYCKSRAGRTIEYKVEHSPWRAWVRPKISIEADLALSYGDLFGKQLNTKWRSAFVAEGSAVSVFSGKKINAV